MGPPGTAHGGITCGRLATYLGAEVVEVTLRRPPPLDTDLRVDARPDGVTLWHDRVLVAEARPGTVGLEPPPPVDLETAIAAARHYAGRTIHPFPGCFVCGLDREPPDGLGLRPGPVGPGAVAAAWTPSDDDPAMVWAVLDCAGGWAEDLPAPPLVLARMALRRDGEPAVGVAHVVQGWLFGREGRKTFTGSCLRGSDGRLLALAAHTWIAVDRDRVGRRP